MHILKILAEKGADLALKCCGKTPLHIAEEKGNAATVRFLKAWDIRCQLIADIIQKYGALAKYRIEKIKKCFDDNHEIFLEDNFLKDLRRKLIEVPMQWRLSQRAMTQDDVVEPDDPICSTARLARLR